jgi:hypothetical protein
MWCNRARWFAQGCSIGLTLRPGKLLLYYYSSQAAGYRPPRSAIPHPRSVSSSLNPNISFRSLYKRLYSVWHLSITHTAAYKHQHENFIRFRVRPPRACECIIALSMCTARDRSPGPVGHARAGTFATSTSNSRRSRSTRDFNCRRRIDSMIELLQHHHGAGKGHPQRVYLHVMSV